MARECPSEWDRVKSVCDTDMVLKFASVTPTQSQLFPTIAGRSTSRATLADDCKVIFPLP